MHLCLEIFSILAISKGFLCIKDFRSLDTDLLANYSSAIKPRKNIAEPVYVNVTFYTNSIQEIDERLQHMTFKGWFEICWRDDFLTWDENEYGGIRFMNLPTTDVWRPDVSIYLKEGNPQDIGKGEFVSVSSSGLVIWYPGDKYTTECMVDITRFPLDEQQCVVKLGPWQTTDWTQVLSPVLDHVNIYKYVENGEWELLRTEVFTKKLAFFDMTEINHVFYLRRRPLYAIMGHLLPVVLLSFLNSLVFCLPASSGEKLTLCVSVLLSFTVFLTIFQQMMPKKSTEIPYVSMYLCFQLFMSVMSVLGTILVWRIQDKAVESKRKSNQNNVCRENNNFVKYSNAVKSVQKMQIYKDYQIDISSMNNDDLADDGEADGKSFDGTNFNEIKQNVFSVEVSDFPPKYQKRTDDDFEKYNNRAKRLDKIFFIVSISIMVISTTLLIIAYVI